MAGVLYRLGRLCANHAIVVVVVWLGLVVLVQLAVRNIGAETSNDLSLPGTESQQATDLLASRFPPQQNGSSPVVFHVAKGKITDAANKQAVESSYKLAGRHLFGAKLPAFLRPRTRPGAATFWEPVGGDRSPPTRWPADWPRWRCWLP